LEALQLILLIFFLLILWVREGVKVGGGVGGEEAITGL
jgi:hypothetical protein